MTRQFTYHDQQWEVVETGDAFGASFAYIPKLDTKGVIFRCVADSTRSDVRATVRTDDLGELDSDRLRRELCRALVRQAIDGSQDKWRTVESLAEEIGIPLEEIHDRLKNLANDFVRAARPDQGGHALYTTRHRYSEE